MFPSVKIQPHLLVAYNNSYNDTTIATGVNYAPLKTNIGGLKADLGVTAGVAYTEKGSYAKEMPKLSAGNFTAIGGLYSSIEHVKSGFGIEATVIPPLSKTQYGFIGLSMRQRF